MAARVGVQIVFVDASNAKRFQLRMAVRDTDTVWTVVKDSLRRLALQHRANVSHLSASDALISDCSLFPEDELVPLLDATNTLTVRLKGCPTLQKVTPEAVASPVTAVSDSDAVPRADSVPAIASTAVPQDVTPIRRPSSPDAPIRHPATPPSALKMEPPSSPRDNLITSPFDEASEEEEEEDTRERVIDECAADATLKDDDTMLQRVKALWGKSTPSVQWALDNPTYIDDLRAHRLQAMKRLHKKGKPSRQAPIDVDEDPTAAHTTPMRRVSSSAKTPTTKPRGGRVSTPTTAAKPQQRIEVGDACELSKDVLNDPEQLFDAVVKNGDILSLPEVKAAFKGTKYQGWGREWFTKGRQNYVDDPDAARRKKRAVPTKESDSLDVSTSTLADPEKLFDAVVANNALLNLPHVKIAFKGTKYEGWGKEWFTKGRQDYVQDPDAIMKKNREEAKRRRMEAAQGGAGQGKPDTQPALA